MEQEIYQRLARHLDDLPGGYPPTESGVELHILSRLFTPEEAELAMHLTLLTEEARVVARRAKITVEEAERRLDEMAKKGLIFAVYPQDGSAQYQALQYAVGIWELQVQNLDPELVRDMKEYWPTFFDLDLWKNAPQLRTIPIKQSIDAPLEVMPYERAEELVRAHDRIAVSPCVCRREHRIAGEGCDKPEETCLQLGMFADFAQRHGMGRSIDQEEALEILEKAERAGLVLQPSNTKDAVFLCSCCGCCCAVLQNIKRHPQPATLVSTPFVAVLTQDTCTGCGTCIDRCQMEALHLADGKSVLNGDRCIGCGLCVSTCPTDSLALTRKPESAQARVPKDVEQGTIQLGQVRGKLGTAELVKMMVRSKVDRLLAPR